MKLTGQLDVGAVVITAGQDPAAPRVWIRYGKTRLSLTEHEAVHVATQLVNAIDQLRQTDATTEEGNTTR